MSLIYIFINVLTMLRYFRWVDFFLGSVTESLRIAICFIVIFFVMVFGMAVCSMTLYGNQYLQYSSFFTSIIYLFAFSVFTGDQGESKFDTDEYVFKFINMVFYYVVFSYLVFAVFISIMYDAYRTISIEKGDPLKSN